MTSVSPCSQRERPERDTQNQNYQITWRRFQRPALSAIRRVGGVITRNSAPLLVVLRGDKTNPVICNPVDTSLVLLAAVREGVVVGDVLRGGHRAHKLQSGLIGLWKEGGQRYVLIEEPSPSPNKKEKLILSVTLSMCVY